MFRSTKIKHILSIILIAASMLSFDTAAAAKAVITPYSCLPKMTDTSEYVVEVNSTNGKPRSYRIFSQSRKPNSKKTYISTHGCAVSALTTVLSGYSARYGNFTPTQTYKTLEKKVFGLKKWRANYRKSKAKQMPVSLYGITKVLKHCKIKAKYVRFFKDARAIRQIENHLKKGKPVIIEVNNHRQTNGRVSKRYDSKWALTKHTMVLLGMTDNGKVIVADSAYKPWSGMKQRVKYTRMKSLIHYMVPSRAVGKSLYFESINTNGGYILVK